MATTCERTLRSSSPAKPGSVPSADCSLSQSDRELLQQFAGTLAAEKPQNHAQFIQYLNLNGKVRQPNAPGFVAAPISMKQGNCFFFAVGLAFGKSADQVQQDVYNAASQWFDVNELSAIVGSAPSKATPAFTVTRAVMCILSGHQYDKIKDKFKDFKAATKKTCLMDLHEILMKRGDRSNDEYGGSPELSILACHDDYKGVQVWSAHWPTALPQESKFMTNLSHQFVPITHFVYLLHNPDGGGHYSLLVGQSQGRTLAQFPSTCELGLPKNVALSLGQSPPPDPVERRGDRHLPIVIELDTPQTMVGVAGGGHQPQPLPDDSFGMAEGMPTITAAVKTADFRPALTCSVNNPLDKQESMVSYAQCAAGSLAKRSEIHV